MQKNRHWTEASWTQTVSAVVPNHRGKECFCSVSFCSEVFNLLWTNSLAFTVTEGSNRNISKLLMNRMQQRSQKLTDTELKQKWKRRFSGRSVKEELSLGERRQCGDLRDTELTVSNSSHDGGLHTSLPVLKKDLFLFLSLQKMSELRALWSKPETSQSRAQPVGYSGPASSHFLSRVSCSLNTTLLIMRLSDWRVILVVLKLLWTLSLSQFSLFRDLYDVTEWLLPPTAQIFFFVP